MDLTQYVKQALNTSVAIAVEMPGIEHVNEIQYIKIDNGKIVFVKRNKKAHAHLLLAGEFESLEAMYNTRTVRVPKPLAIIDRPKSAGGGCGLVLEHIYMKTLDKYQGVLGEHFAQLHLHNGSIHEKSDSANITPNEPQLPPVKYVGRFGFHCPTFNGFLAQSNHWEKDWVKFYVKRIMQPQIDMLQYKFREKEAVELWGQVLRKMPYFFRDIIISPSLLHGGFWFGSTAEDENGPVIYDPACFYGHHEYDLAFCKQYGGFSKSFFDNYRFWIPKDKGFDDRAELYRLTHYLHNWNHYGIRSKPVAIQTLRDIAKKCESIV